MATFLFKALDPSGMVIQGSLEAMSQGEVITHIQETLEYTPLKIWQKREATLKGLMERFKKVPLLDVLNFTKQLYTLETAGVPILSSLSALKEQAGTKVFQEILEIIHRDVEGGSSLSEALQRHTSVFPEFYIHSVRAGEAAGALDTVLLKLNEQLAKQDSIQKRVKKALRYPIMVLTAISIAFTVIITFVLPKFIAMFASAGGESALPLPTRILLGISSVVGNYWYLIFGSIILIAVLFNKYIHTKQGRYSWDGLKLKLPVFGKLFHMVAIGRFTSTLQTLNKSGLPIIESLDIGGKACGNQVVDKAVKEIIQSVKKGHGLTAPFQKSKMFPPLVIQMISVGEESGSLDAMLENISDHFETVVDDAVDGLTGTIEPIMTIVIGALVALLAMGMFLPMWSMMDAMNPK